MPSDAEFMERVRQRDTDAFEALSERYRASIHRHVHATLHEHSVAEDVVREVFLRLWLCYTYPC